MPHQPYPPDQPAPPDPPRPWTRYYHEATGRELPALPWPHLPAYIDAAIEKHNERTAFTVFLPNGTQGSLTYAEAGRLSDQFAAYLREVAGFSAGDRIALLMPNCLAYPIAVFGCLKAGLVMVNTNPLYTTAEMTHQFTDSGAVGLVAIDVFANKVAAVLPNTSIRTVVVVSVADLLPPLKRFVVRSVQRYVKKMLPPVTFTHVTFPDALEAGAARIAKGADPRSYRAGLSQESLAALQY